MTDAQIIAARTTFSLLGRARPMLRFFYLSGNEDGLPVLLLDPDEVDPAAVDALLDDALDARTAEGSLRWQESGTLLLSVEEGDTLALLEQMDDFLDKVLPGLRFAQVKGLAPSTL